MSQNFEPGTISKKTTEEVFALLKTAAKSEWKIDAAAIKPVFDSDKSRQGIDAILGFEFTHAEPAPRATRKDKGSTRKKEAAQTDPKPVEKTKVAPKSPFGPLGTTDQKAAS